MVKSSWFILQFSLIIFLLPFCLQAQTNPRAFARPVIQPVFKQKKFDQYVTTTDVNGRPFKNVINDVEGSPYFIDEFRFADIILSKGTVYENLKVKIDICNQEAHLIADDQKEIIAEDGLIREIILADSAGGSNYFIFKTGFPPINKNNTNSFYQILSDGEIQLLKFAKKEIVETKDVMSGEVSKAFVQYDDYYVFQNGEIEKLKKDKKFVLALMNDQQQKIVEYLKDKKINFKNVGALTYIFDYYNSLKKAF